MLVGGGGGDMVGDAGEGVVFAEGEPPVREEELVGARVGYVGVG